MHELRSAAGVILPAALLGLDAAKLSDLERVGGEHPRSSAQRRSESGDTSFPFTTPSTRGDSLLGKDRFTLSIEGETKEHLDDGVPRMPIFLSIPRAGDKDGPGGGTGGGTGNVACGRLWSLLPRPEPPSTQ